PINPLYIPAGFTAKDLSPYFHKIRIGTVYSGSEYSDGQVSLYASFYSSDQSGVPGTVSINVSGWFLRAREGSQIVPQAVNVYDPSGLTAEADIYLKEGDALNIYTGTSAISKNLHLNKCLGFLENTNHFTPSLPKSCPYVERQEISGFSGECQDYILSLGSCGLPEPNPPLPENDYGCRAYLNAINYKGCFERYRADADFLSREWWAWTGSKFLDERHDKLMLLDRKGLLVDLYEY
ncbi:MAG: hypothetical protein Q7R94_01815, partial [bacterium]|nr:hypothetical protein [bacterium]